MAQKLIIVESPAKAKTIEGYLGSTYKVISCYGHIRDLPKTNKAIDIDNGFQPTYVINPDKLKIVQQLRREVKKSSAIYLASDADREGEAISWHLKEALALPTQNTKRIVFREITADAIRKALAQPRDIDYDLVHAQQARRILDRLVGFGLSPLLWQKIQVGLSAGRVQSIAVKLIVTREREIIAFKPQTSYKINAQFELAEGKYLDASLVKALKDETAARDFLTTCQKALFTVKAIQQTPLKKNPSAPFTTSTLQQEAGQRFGYTVNRTMRLAQSLYEQGKISYMRTDSMHLGDEALAKIKKVILADYGPSHFHPRHYKTKVANAQEAHEAIRPTNPALVKASFEPATQRLYQLIRNRTLASQMAPATFLETKATLAISTSPHTLIAKGAILKTKGFLALQDNLPELKILPALTVGQPLQLRHMKAVERFTRPPARYTEGSLVKVLKEKGIGRPSTYAPTLATIQKRNYVTRDTREGTTRTYTTLTLQGSQITQQQCREKVGAAKNKLFPEAIAFVVTDFLQARFKDILDYQFTAQVEAHLDAIAQKKQPWQAMLQTFYKPFNKQINQTKADTQTARDIKSLGIDAATGQEVLLRIGRYGPYVQLGEATGDQKPKRASLAKHQLPETLTLPEAIKLFCLPRTLDKSFETHPMMVASGRYGPYVKHNNTFYSLGKTADPYTITSEEAIALIEQKRAQAQASLLKKFDNQPDIEVRQGRWGPYLKTPHGNIKLPKDSHPETITFAECEALINAAKKKKRKK